MYLEKNIATLEFEQKHPGNINLPMVALYNEAKISKANVEKAIANYGISDPPNIIIISKAQYESVFLDDGSFGQKTA